MIRFLTGQPTLLTDNNVVIDVHGVGYGVEVPLGQTNRICSQEKVTLEIFTLVREDALSLYGFLESRERLLFEQLLSVSGVGPRSAMMIVDRGASAVVEAIQQSDVSFFQSIPRLGKKTSQKIIVDLQSKIGSWREFSLPPGNGTARDVYDALQSMGYAPRLIDEVMSKLDPEWDVATAIKWSLQNIGKLNGQNKQKSANKQ